MLASAFLSLLGLLAVPSRATVLQLERKTLDYEPALSRKFAPRAAGDGGSTNSIKNIGNSQYVSNITIGGSNFVVILDTGSSDLWIAGKAAQSTDTGEHASIQYAIGNAAGNIHTSNVTFADFHVPSQAYIQVDDTTSFGSLAAVGITGLAGLGPGFASNIYNQIGAGKGDTLLDNIFQQNKTSNNFVTFLLSRNGDMGKQVDSTLTISEVLPDYADVTKQPQLEVDELRNASRVNQHWTTLLEGIIGPDGKAIELDSIVSGTHDRLIAVLDSGFTFNQVPRYVSDAIYGRVNGAQYSKSDGVWLIPCGQELNVTVIFGGQKYPVHPLDTSSKDYGSKFEDGSEACLGTFQPISTAFSLGGEFDTIMGEAFLRSAYTLLDWGDFVSETTDSKGNPYVQLLSILDPTDAHNDFVQSRLGGVDTSGDPKYKLSSHQKKSPVSPGERVQHLEGFAYRNRAAIAAGAVGGFVLLILVSAFGLWHRRRQRRRNLGFGKGGAIPLGSTNSLAPQSESYRTIHDPKSVPYGGQAQASQENFHNQGFYGGSGSRRAY